MAETPELQDSLAEIEAMKAITTALSSIPVDGRKRVLRWALERFDAEAVSFALTPSAPGKAPLVPAAEPESSTDLSDLYHRCDPTTDAEKTLVVSYWLQESAGLSGIDAQSVNSELKHLGHGVGNITRAFDRLKQNRPQLVIQTRKAGSSRQARKTYKVTAEGRSFVEQLRDRASRRPTVDQR